jgi:GH43 family beta-xylosidase
MCIRDRSQNLAEANPEVVRRLHEALMDWNAQMPRDAGDPKWKGHGRAGSLMPNEFTNPIGEGADPWVIRDPNTPRYLWCMSEGNRAIAIHTSDSVTSMGQKHVVWQAPPSGPVSQQVWAPELHYLDGRWYVYFAASDGENKNHLAYVLRSKTDDPLGQYDLHGPLATGDGEDGMSPNIWAIDMTVLEHHGKRYALWSGWDQPGSDQQYLYIAPMKSPTKLAGPRVRICDNDDFLWERVEPDPSQRGLHEAPQVFQAKGQTAVVYSCGASWLPTYKLGLLELVGSDPLVPASWKKRPQSVFAGTPSTFGVGHSCFVKSLDDRQWWHVFHAKQDREPGWRRAVFVQPMRVGKRGFPLFGEPIQAGEVLQRPSGDAVATATFSAESLEYYGHHQYFRCNGRTIRLGRIPEHPINEYRSGEKVVFSGFAPKDVRAEVTIDFHGDSDARDAGILFRTTGAALGYDAQRGYFAGLIPRTQIVILGRTDGSTWREIARARTRIDAKRPQQLTVQVQGDCITVWHDGSQKIQHTDETYDRGSVGLRVVNVDASFSDLGITPLSGQ